MAKKVVRKKKKPDDGDKLRSFVYEMGVEAMADNDESHKNTKLVSVCGVVLKSNFMEEGSRFCAPLAFNPIRHRLFLGDRLKVTLYCRRSDISKTGETKVSFAARGMKYEVWDDATEGWACLYDKFENDGQRT